MNFYYGDILRNGSLTQVTNEGETQLNAWYLYQMVTQNTLRTFEGKQVVSENYNYIYIQ